MGNVFNTNSTVQLTQGCLTQSVALSSIMSLGSAIRSNTTGAAGAEQITNMIKMTKAQYDALATKDPNTIYVIRG